MGTKRVLQLMYKGKVLFRIGIGKTDVLESFKLEILDEVHEDIAPVFTIPG